MRRNSCGAGWRSPAAVLAVTLLGLCATDAAATEARPTDAFTSLFEQTCVRHRDAPEALAAQLLQWGALVMPADEAKRFLADAEGTAWALQRQQVRYVVTLQRSGRCNLMAQRADAKAVQRNFPLLALDSPPPFTARRIDDTTAPQDKSASTLAYAWTAPGLDWEWRLTLTLSGDRSRTLRAVASLARIASTP